MRGISQRKFLSRVFSLKAVWGLWLLLASFPVGAQSLAVTSLGSQPPTSLVQALLGPGVTYSNVSYKGNGTSSGTFAGGASIIGFDSGIILSNGAAASVVAGPVGTTCNNLAGDPDLTVLSGGVSTYDATVLEFDFIPTFDTITFNYVFASDEYNQFVGSYNDSFGFFVNGTNVALIPGTSTVVSINKVNNCFNPNYFIDNSNEQYSSYCSLTRPTANLKTSMFELTTVLNVTAAVNPGVSNHIKLAIADAGDCYVDSNVFIQAGSFTSQLTSTPTVDLSSSPTPCGWPGNTCTSSPTATGTWTPTATSTPTPCGWPGNTCTPTLTFTVTPTPTVTLTPVWTSTSTPTKTPTYSPTPSLTFTPTPTSSPTDTTTRTFTITVTYTPTPCGWPGNTCTATPTPLDAFYISKNAFLANQEPLTIAVSFPRTGNFSLKIYNSVGEHIRTLDNKGKVENGFTGFYLWDGKNKHGEDCGSGVYLIYYIEPFKRRLARVILIRQ